MKNDNHITTKEAWVDRVLASTQGMQRAMAPHDLYEKILLKLNNPAKTKVIQLPAIKWAAAALLLLAVNVGSLVYASSYSAGQKTATNNPVAAQIQSESTYNY